MTWCLRRAGTGDAPALSLVAGATFLETFAGVLRGGDIVAHVSRKSDVASFAGWIADPRCVVALAEHPDGAAPVGYTLLAPADLPVEPGPADVELRCIYTLSIARGSGLGAVLMERAIDDARALGATRLLLGVHAGNARARNFYERQGFAVAGERRFLVGETWCDDLVYVRAV